VRDSSATIPAPPPASGQSPQRHATPPTVNDCGRSASKAQTSASTVTGAEAAAADTARAGDAARKDLRRFVRHE